MCGGLSMGARRRNDREDLEHVGAAARLLGAEGYERSRIQPYIARIHDAMLASMASEVDSPDSVLDVGCGTGRLLRKIGQRWPGSRLTGVDPTEAMISVARRLAPSVSFHVASAESMPIASASIDLAFSSISFHHWGNQLQGLHELARTLRPGGRLCLADITMPRWMSKLVRSKAQSPTAIRRLMAQTDLELQELRLILSRIIVVVVAVKPAVRSRGMLGGCRER